MLYCAIKRTLNSGGKDEPDVRVEVDVLEDVFNDVLGNVVDSKWERGKLVHIIPTNRVLSFSFSFINFANKKKIHKITIYKLHNITQITTYDI